jgi:hypothetical protein
MLLIIISHTSRYLEQHIEKPFVLCIVVKILLCHYCHRYECDYKRVLYLWPDLLDSSILHFTVHYYTYTSVHSHFFIAVAW